MFIYSNLKNLQKEKKIKERKKERKANTYKNRIKYNDLIVLRHLK